MKKDTTNVAFVLGGALNSALWIGMITPQPHSYLGPPLRQFDALQALTSVVRSPPLFAQVFTGQLTYPLGFVPWALASPAFSKKGSAPIAAMVKNFSISASVGLFAGTYNHHSGEFSN